jgi:plastocyanin
MKTRSIWNGRLALIGLVFLLSACFAPAPTTTPAPPTSPVPPVSPAPTPPAPSADVNACPDTIGIDGSSFRYAPSSCTIHLNGSSKTVTISASNSHPLDAISDNWPRPISAALSDQTVTFAAPGVYRFRCRAHFSQAMTGTITIEN